MDRDQGNVVLPPSDPNRWPQFRIELQEWKKQTLQDLKFDDAIYRDPAFAWTQHAYNSAMLMMWDRAFVDPDRAKFRTRQFIEDGKRRFGGYDAVVLWHAYPRIGLDNRNQFDFYREQPGGLDGLRELSREFRAAGIRVFINYNPWDTGTRREGVSDAEGLARMAQALDLDGIYLDTLDQGVDEFYSRFAQVKPGLAVEGEGNAPLHRLHQQPMSWGQWFHDVDAPGILRNKWLEPRHMTHLIHRWDRDHAEELQLAWMNGTGMTVWENVFGCWNGWCERDQSILRSMVSIQRRYSNVLNHGVWTPLVPTTHPAVYAHRWQLGNLRLYTLVNRSTRDLKSPVLEVDWNQGDQAFDLIAGREAKGEHSGSCLRFEATIRSRGISCLLVGPERDLGAGFESFLAGQHEIDRDANWSTEFHPHVAKLKFAASSPPVKPGHAVAGMIAHPAYHGPMKTELRVREVGFYEAQSDVSLSGWFLHSRLVVERTGHCEGFLLDALPVTNDDFHAFIKESGYRPKHDTNFLKHWEAGAPPAGKGNHPVVYVDLDDARAYSKWAGKRLPSEDEWQVAAMDGVEESPYPWGWEFDAKRCNGDGKDTTPVDQFPNGATPRGVKDLCGNVWEWTESVRTDGRNEFCMLHGGSFYEAKGSPWYTDGGARSGPFAAKIVLYWAGLDRCATVGFRCAKDIDWS